MCVLLLLFWVVFRLRLFVPHHCSIFSNNHASRAQSVEVPLTRRVSDGIDLEGEVDVDDDYEVSAPPSAPWVVPNSGRPSKDQILQKKKERKGELKIVEQEEVIAASEFAFRIFMASYYCLLLVCVGF